jgi:hypothetical protein
MHVKNFWRFFLRKTGKSKDKVLGRTDRLLSWYDTDRIENDASNNSPIAACVFVAAVTSLPSRYLATIGGYTYRHTDWLEGFIKYAVEMGSGAMIYTPSFIKSSSEIQKVIGGKHRQHDLISLLLYFQNKVRWNRFVSAVN